jgi:hypothetical protein
MKLLLVTSVDPTTCSVSTVHKYVIAGRALGYNVVVYGEPRSDMPALPFTTDLIGVDLALFIIQVPSDFPDMPYLARLLDGIPCERRLVLDLWGRFNDTLRLDHDFNHLEEARRSSGMGVGGGHAGSLRPILQPTLSPLRSEVRTFLFHGFEPGSVAKVHENAGMPPLRGAVPAAEKPYGVIYVREQLAAWDQVRRFLEQWSDSRRSRTGVPRRLGLGQTARLGRAGRDHGHRYRPDYAR